MSLSDIAICHSAVHAAHSAGGGHHDFVSKLDFDNYTFLFSDPLYINAYLVESEDRGHLDVPDAAHRLSDGVRHGARAESMAADAADAGHPAVLDVVPAARLRVDRPAEERTACSTMFLMSSASSTSRSRCCTRLRRLHRHRLLVPAVHDPAAVLEPREDRPHAARGGGGSRRAALAGILAGHACRCRCPGIIAGCMLVFIPAVGEFVIPALLGGSDTLMIGGAVG